MRDHIAAITRAEFENSEYPLTEIPNAIVCIGCRAVDDDPNPKPMIDMRVSGGASVSVIMTLHEAANLSKILTRMISRANALATHALAQKTHGQDWVDPDEPPEGWTQ